MKPFLLILLLSACQLLSIVASAQTPAAKYLNFSLITISDGLSQGMVTCMLQDHFGFMWFGTKDGLNRYDGFKFVVYRHDANDNTTIADNFIKAIYEDNAGRLWVGTAGRGADMFDRSTETFFHFEHDEKNNASLSDNRVNKITGDRFGNIWVSTYNGLNKIAAGMLHNQSSKQVYSSLKITRYFKDECLFTEVSDGTIWGSSLHYGSYHIHPLSKDSVQIDTLDMGLYCSYPQEDKGLEKIIRLIVEDTINHALYLVAEYSIARVDMKSNEVKIVSMQRNHWGIIGNTGCIDAGGMLWLSETDWLEQFDTRSNQWYRILTADAALQFAVSNTGITYRDRSGIIWIGTKGNGILKYNPDAEKFHKTDDQSVQWMAACSNDSEVIVLKDRRFLCTFNPYSGKFTVLNDSAFIPQINSFSDFGITNSAVQDRNNVYWMSKQSLLRFNPSTNKISYLRASDRNVFPVFIDHDQQIWFGTEAGLSMLDPVSNHITDYRYPVQPQREPYEFLQCMIEDAEGVFWLGTTKGLLRLNKEDNSWKQFKNNPADTSTLSFDLIFTLCNDPVSPEKYLWIGTNGGGLNRLDKHTGKVMRYSMKNGLPNDVVYGILNDADGNLWMSTNNGLARFSLQTKSFKVYEMKDGLQSNEFNRYAYCAIKNMSGSDQRVTLFFGGVNGFNYFNPRDLSESPFIPEIQITDFRLRNKPVSFSTKNTALSQPVFLTDKIVLPYRDNMISFEFAAMDFTAPEKNDYRYRLEGFDADWVQSGNNHVATYTNLDPGTYTFTVLGTNNDGVWNEKGKSLQLIILPPWYMTWWFRTLLVLAVAGILYAVYRYRLQQALKLQAVRNRIASDLHDEIGSNLSSISIFSEVAMEKNDTPASIQPLLKKISDYTHISKEAMSDIVWMINARNDRFENIIVRMRQLAAELFEAKHCNLKLDFDERLNAVKMGMEERKNFYLIYKEALNNIAKYAECKNVGIELRLDHAEIVLKIEDDGKGFNIQHVQQGNGFGNMQRRAEALKGNLLVTSNVGEGTSVELRFAV